MPGPFDFEDQSDADQGGPDIIPSRGSRSRYVARNNSRGLLIAIAILQVFACIVFVCSWPLGVLMLAVLQVAAALIVALESRGKGAEAAIWAMLMLFFPVIGPIIYVVAV